MRGRKKLNTKDLLDFIIEVRKELMEAIEADDRILITTSYRRDSVGKVTLDSEWNVGTPNKSGTIEINVTIRKKKLL